MQWLGRQPAHQRLGQRVQEETCRLAHQRLGPRVPRRSRRRISPPDGDGWQAVLNWQGEPPIKSGAARQPRHHKRIPDFLEGRCLNCFSYNHRIATCRRPLRCFNCHGSNHMGRTCKRPRSPNNGGGRANHARDHFVRARCVPDSDDTPAGSQASGSTPENSTCMGGRAAQRLRNVIRCHRVTPTSVHGRAPASFSGARQLTVRKTGCGPRSPSSSRTPLGTSL